MIDHDGTRAVIGVATGVLGKLAAVIGVVSSVGAGWIAIGLPMPATQSFVGDQVARVEKRIDGLAASTLELQRDSIVGRKARLRFEVTANAAAASRAADAAQRATLKRRAEEIQDELADLDKRDDALRARIDRLRPDGGGG